MRQEATQSRGVSPVVITPTYNNDSTLEQIILRVKDQGLPLIVVNDGCRDGSAEILARYACPDGTPPVVVAKHRTNRGKAAALRTGFKLAMQLGYTHGITIDTDGQHDPEEIDDLLSVARRHPEALVIGTRSPGIDGYPARSMLGRRLSNRLIRWHCGLNVHDSQSGFRVYPLELIRQTPTNTQRFNFETEIIIRAGWRGRRVIDSPITSRYLPVDQRVSHFRPIVDTIRSMGMHVRLLGNRLARECERDGIEKVESESTWLHRVRGFLTCGFHAAAQVAPLSGFLLASRCGRTAEEGWQLAFLVGGSLALMALLLARLTKRRIDPMLLAINLFMTVGGVGVALDYAPILAFYDMLRESAMFLFMLMVGILAMYFSPKGCLKTPLADPGSTRRASIGLLIVIASALLFSLWFRGHTHIAGTLPLIVIMIARSSLGSWLARYSMLPPTANPSLSTQS